MKDFNRVSIMKKYIIIALSSCMVLFGCAKELVNEYVEKSAKIEGEISFVANADNSGDTKTSLEGTTIEWIKADQVMIFGTDGVGGSGSPKVSGYAAAASGESVKLDWNMNISGVEGAFTSSQTPQYAFYPYNSTNVPSIDESVITFVLPQTQVYQKAASFGKDANVAVGKVTTSGGTGSIAFKNVCGYLRLKLSVASGDAATVGKIVLTTKGTEKLWGTFTADADSDAPTAAYKSGASDGGTSITLNCPGGVALSKDSANPTVFYFVVPEGALEDGFTAEVYSTQEHLIKTLSSTSSKTISRNSVRSIANQTLNWLPEGYTECKYIQNNSDAYINTGFIASNEHTIELKFQSAADISSLSYDWTCIYGVWSNASMGSDGIYWLRFGTNNGSIYNIEDKWYEYTDISSNIGLLSDYYAKVIMEYKAVRHMDYRKVTINGVVVTDKKATHSSISFTDPMCLFGVIRPGYGFNYPAKIKMFYARILDASDNIVRDFIPAYNETTEKYGMYEVSETAMSSTTSSYFYISSSGRDFGGY